MREKWLALCLKSIILFVLIMGTVLLSTVPKASGTSGPAKQEKQSIITPADLLENMSPGWNLGNTLDAVPTEGSWNNPPVREHTFDDIRDAGFKSVRIPVTWDSHIGSAPGYLIDTAWMNRVEEVTDWALEREFYVVLNIHHDSWLWISRMGNSQQETLDKLGKVWKQIAERFKNKSERLLFEIVNEPTGMNAYQMNLLNREMLNIIRSTDGNNSQRLVIVGGLKITKMNCFIHLNRLMMTGLSSHITTILRGITYQTGGAGRLGDRQPKSPRWRRISNRFMKNL